MLDIFIRRVNFLRPSRMYSKWLAAGFKFGDMGLTGLRAAWLLQTKYLDCQLDGIGTRLKDPGSALNENIMRFVWDESLDQAREMLQSWTSGAEPGITRSVAEDTRMLSLNILAATGFL